MTLRISSSRPMTGSIFWLRARSTRSVPYFFQRVVGALRAVAGDPGISPDPHKALQHRVFLNAVLPEQPGQRVVRQLDQAEEKVLDRDIFVLHALGLPARRR